MMTTKGKSLPSGEKPDWLAYMVDLREAFAGTGFYVDSTPHWRCHLQTLTFHSTAKDGGIPGVPRVNEGELSSMTAYGCYGYEAFRCVHHAVVHWKDSSDIWVVPEVHVRASEVHTAGEPVPWALFI